MVAAQALGKRMFSKVVDSTITPRCPRYRSLDFWRGIACLMIVVYHTCAYQLSAPNASANIIAYAWLGVPLFFVFQAIASAQRAMPPGASRLR